MTEKYSIKEIIIFAIEIEKEGSLFYSKIANKSLNNKLKSLYLNLKEEEDKHKIIYEDILDSLGPDTNEYIYHLENEYIAYLHSFIEKAVFDSEKIDSIISNFTNEFMAIDFAIKKENDSIDFYNNMKNLVSSENVIKIDKIIEEEKKHIDKLMNVKSSL